jgi:hypothetical protein
MIVVRDIFQLKFGKARDAIALLQEGLQFMRENSANAPREARVLTDLTGQYYTIVLETVYDGLSAFETNAQSMMGDPKWKEWYARYTPLVDSGRREIFTLVGSAIPSLPAADRERAGATR